MSPLVWQFAVAAAAGTLLLLPWWLWRQAKVMPQSAAGTSAHLNPEDWLAPAANLQTQIEAEYQRLLEVAGDSGAVRGANDIGIPFVVLGPRDHLAEHLPPSARRLRLMVVAARSLDVPAELACERPLFAQSRASIGSRAHIRCVLARHEVVVGMRARVTRWAHAERRLEAAEGAELYGCASAGQELTLARRGRFERLIAPVIYFGKPDSRFEDFGLQRLPLAPPANVESVAQNRWLVQGNLEVPSGRQIEADLVVSGSLLLQADSRIIGKVFAAHDIVLQARAAIDGSAVCERDITLMNDAQISGAVLAQRKVLAHRRVYIGTQERRTSLVARHIEVHESCVVYGAVWAQSSGRIVAPRKRSKRVS